MHNVVPFRSPASKANRTRRVGPMDVSKFRTIAASDKRPPIALILATILLFLAQLAPAAPVTFWFTGTVEYTNDPSGNRPSGIVIGTPFAGKVTYDGDYLAYHGISGGGAVGDYYFRKLEGFSAHIQIGSHTLTNANLSNSGRSGNSWPITVAGGVLQRSAGLIPGDWHDVGETVVAEGMKNAVILPSEAEGRLFRLVLR